jgi:hypothetical protein
MRITSLRVTPVASVLAIIYAILAPFSVIQLKLSGANRYTLPLGVVAPLVHLNLNLTVPMPSSVLPGLLLCVAAICFYAVTGWLTGAVAVLSFNLVARLRGGIEASVLTREPIASSGAR